MKTDIKDGKLIIELDADVIDTDILSFISSMEISKKSKMSEEQIFELSEEIKENWWKENKDKFVDEE
jgi:phosphotransferase system IIA component